MPKLTIEEFEDKLSGLIKEERDHGSELDAIILVLELAIAKLEESRDD